MKKIISLDSKEELLAIQRADILNLAKLIKEYSGYAYSQRITEVNARKKMVAEADKIMSKYI